MFEVDKEHWGRTTRVRELRGTGKWGMCSPRGSVESTRNEGREGRSTPEGGLMQGWGWAWETGTGKQEGQWGLSTFSLAGMTSGFPGREWLGCWWLTLRNGVKKDVVGDLLSPLEVETESTEKLHQVVCYEARDKTEELELKGGKERDFLFSLTLKVT